MNIYFHWNRVIWNWFYFILLDGIRTTEMTKLLMRVTYRWSIGYDSYPILGFNVIRAKDWKRCASFVSAEVVVMPYLQGDESWIWGLKQAWYKCSLSKQQRGFIVWYRNEYRIEVNGAITCSSYYHNCFNLLPYSTYIIPLNYQHFPKFVRVTRQRWF